jgi:hypothetical protein
VGPQLAHNQHGTGEPGGDEEMGHTITFAQGEETKLARFLAQLVREGIQYSIRQDAHSYEVTLTGGY